MKTPSQIVELDLLGILNEIFCGDFPQDRQPEGAAKPNEIERAKTTSPVAVRLYAASDILTDHGIALQKEHRAAHEEAAKCQHSPTDCAAYRSRMEIIKNRLNALRGLFWRAVTEEHPAVAESNVTLRNGMVLVSKFGSDWDDTVASDPADSIIKTVTVRLGAIMRGSAEINGEDPNDAVGENETVLGTVEDGRIRLLWNLRDQLIGEMKSRKPADLDPEKDESVGNWLLSHSLKEANDLVALTKRYKKAIDVLETVAWTVIRDSLKDGHDQECIGLRKDWQVVSLPPEPEDESGVKVHELGGAIVIDIPLGRGASLSKDMPPEVAAALGRVLSRARV